VSQQFVELRLRFDFPDGWSICRPQDCSFYVRHFQGFAGGCKEVDFLAYDPASRILWLVEVKDYSTSGRAKSLAVEEEMAEKVRDVLALLPAAVRDNSAGSETNLSLAEFWQRARSLSAIRVVLHFEIPRHPSKLFPVVMDMANLQMLLRRAVRAVDPRALVTDRANPAGTPWTVT
jgi:hypothetical protein